MSEPINPVFPVPAIRDARQLMDIAMGMEHEAARRYTLLARSMEAAQEPDLAKLFAQLAEMETAHEEGLGRWAKREGITDVHPAEPGWAMPETFEDLGGEILLLTPYKALAMAVRNEERAFSFFTYLAAMASDDTTRRLAESLAREELSHVARLRTMRRTAFRSGPREDTAGRIDAATGSPGAFEHVVGGLEGGCEELYDLAARELAHGGDDAGATILREAARRSRLLSAGGLPAGPESSALAAARAAGLVGRGNLTRDGVLKLCLRNAEEVLEIYLGVADRTADGAVLVQAQQLAESAVVRLAMVRSQILNADA